MCNLSCATWYERTAQLLRLAEFKWHFILASSDWLNHNPMKEGEETGVTRETPDDELQKMPYTKARNSSPNRDLNSHSSIGDRLGKQTCRRTQAIEMRCFSKFLVISYKDHITNKDMKSTIGNAIEPYEDLLTSAKRRKLKWYGHVTRSSGLAKTILQGTVQGGRRRGRQRKRWEDNIKEWTGVDWNIILCKAENREEWRKLVVKPPVVPQRSARQRDM